MEFGFRASRSRSSRRSRSSTTRPAPRGSRRGWRFPRAASRRPRRNRNRPCDTRSSDATSLAVWIGSRCGTSAIPVPRTSVGGDRRRRQRHKRIQRAVICRNRAAAWIGGLGVDRDVRVLGEERATRNPAARVPGPAPPGPIPSSVTKVSTPKPMMSESTASRSACQREWFPAVRSNSSAHGAGSSVTARVARRVVGRTAPQSPAATPTAAPPRPMSC